MTWQTPLASFNENNEFCFFLLPLSSSTATEQQHPLLSFFTLLSQIFGWFVQPLLLFFSQTQVLMSLSIILSNFFLFFSIEFYTFTKANPTLLILFHCCSSVSILSNFKITIDFIQLQHARY
jgi:hypothetical protein